MTHVRGPAKNVPDNLSAFREAWPPLVEHAERHGVKIAMENCPMIFSYDEWPGGTSLAYARDLAGDVRSIPSESFGLNFDPSHLVWQMIDYERALYEGMGWQVPRLPGLGQVRWDRFVSALYAIGYDDSLVIEHGDRYFEGEELVKRGFDVARNALRPNVVEADVDA